MGLGVLDDAARDLISLFRDRSMTIALAESCTGGLASAALTGVAGSSDVFERGFVTYSNEAKEELLGVERGTLDQYGAVSEEVALAMARGAAARSSASVAASITGIAGPTGGSVEKPVGLVWFGLCVAREDPTSLVCEFGDLGRHEVRVQAVLQAFEMLTIAGSQARNP